MFSGSGKAAAMPTVAGIVSHKLRRTVQIGVSSREQIMGRDRNIGISSMSTR
jgi:hypothetical protein